MNSQHIDAFAQIPRPKRKNRDFLEDLKKPREYHFQPGRGCFPGETADCMKNGAELRFEPVGMNLVPETALESLHRVLQAKSIPECTGGYPIRFQLDPTLGKEEYRVHSGRLETVVSASDPDGFRRGVYYLEDRIREAEGPAVMTVSRQRHRPVPGKGPRNHILYSGRIADLQTEKKQRNIA